MSRARSNRTREPRGKTRHGQDQISTEYYLAEHQSSGIWSLNPPRNIGNEIKQKIVSQ